MSAKKDLSLEILRACVSIAILGGGYLMFDELRESTAYVAIVVICIVINFCLIVQKYQKLKKQ